MSEPEPYQSIDSKDGKFHVMFHSVPGTGISKSAIKLAHRLDLLPNDYTYILVLSKAPQSWFWSIIGQGKTEAARTE